MQFRCGEGSDDDEDRHQAGTPGSAVNRTRQTNTTSVVLRHQRQPDGPASNLQIEVRRVRWRDLGNLRRIRHQTLLNQPNGRWQTADPFQAGLRQLMPMMPSRDRVAVAQGSGRALGYAVFRVMPPDDRWTLESIGSNTGVYHADPIWEELLRFSIMAAGLEGAKRLYARLQVGSTLITAARKMGFVPYTTEHIYRASSVPVAARSSLVRTQSPSDVWAIHQLYMAVVPRQVQYAEALTSHYWDSGSHTMRHERVRGWLIEDGQQVAGYVRVTTCHDRHILELLVDPEHREVTADLVSTACAYLATMPRRTVFAVVRAYQEELLAVLADLGFEPWLEQDVHVKYTTVQAQAPIINGLPVTQEVPEAVGKRVPTFYDTGGEPLAEGTASSIRIFATTPQT